MNNVVRWSLTVCASVLFGIALGSSSLVFANKDKVEKLPLDDLQTFAEVFDQIKKNYVKEVEDKQLLQNALEGMLEGLDPHSVYLPPEMFQDLQLNTSGQFGGLGIEVTMEDGFVKVVAPIDDTPAFRAGILSGDLIIKLDEKPVKGMTLRDAVNLMRGEIGSDIVLTIVRNKQEKPLKITVTRDTIKVRSVKSELFEGGYGYLRISQFQVGTGKDLEFHIDALKKKADEPLKGVILDLRNNPGGVLKAAVEVADLFLEKGLIVYTEGRIENSHMRFKASPPDELKKAPIVVLVNGGSASASEIVAGALQDHDRAVIMGTKTFGKGSVQTVLPLKNDYALKLTTALYYTPKGRSIQAEGIMPDIAVEPHKLSKVEAGGIENYKEADLQGHLSNGNGADKPKSGAETETGKIDKQSEMLQKDYQLNEALNLLKGIAILTGK